MKQPNQLPSFSRDLKLSFQMNQNQSPNSQEMSGEVKAIYILQKIHSFMTLVVLIWFHDMHQSNQLEKEHLKDSLDL